MIAVDLTVLPVTETVDGVSHLLGDTGGAVDAVDELAREGLVVTLPGRQVVIVVVEGLVEALVIRRDARDVVECLEELLRLVQVALPLRVGARLDSVEEVGADFAAVLRLQAVDVGSLSP